MIDKLSYAITTKYRQLIRVLEELKMPVKTLYKSYFNLVNFLLKKDFENVDKVISPENNYFFNRKQQLNKIWIMWWQGIENAPEIVKSNVSRVQKIFGIENVIIINCKNYKKYTDISLDVKEKFYDGKITLTSWSDIVRFNLLKNNGGIWIDSTVVLSKKILDCNPLNQEFFSLCSQDNYRFVSDGRWTGWMIGGSNNLGLFKYVDEFYTQYFKIHDKIVDYYMIDYIIYHYYKNNKYLQRLIQKENKNWKNFEFTNKLFEPVSDNLIKNFHSKLEYSVQKVTYKKKIPKNLSENSLYELLIKQNI